MLFPVAFQGYSSFLSSYLEPYRAFGTVVCWYTSSLHLGLSATPKWTPAVTIASRFHPALNSAAAVAARQEHRSAPGIGLRGVEGEIVEGVTNNPPFLFHLPPPIISHHLSQNLDFSRRPLPAGCYVEEFADVSTPSMSSSTVISMCMFHGSTVIGWN